MQFISSLETKKTCASSSPVSDSLIVEIGECIEQLPGIELGQILAQTLNQFRMRETRFFLFTRLILAN